MNGSIKLNDQRMDLSWQDYINVQSCEIFLLTNDCFATYCVRYFDVFINQSPYFAGPAITFLCAHLVLYAAILLALFLIAAFFIYKVQQDKKAKFDNAKEILKSLAEKIYCRYGQNTEELKITKGFIKEQLGNKCADQAHTIANNICDKYDITINKNGEVTICAANQAQEATKNDSNGFFSYLLDCINDCGYASWIYWIVFSSASVLAGAVALTIVPTVFFVLIAGVITFLNVKKKIDSQSDLQKSLEAIPDVNFMLACLVHKKDDEQEANGTNNESNSVPAIVKIRTYLTTFVISSVTMFIILEFTAWMLTDAIQALAPILMHIIMFNPILLIAGIIVIAALIAIANSRNKNPEDKKFFSECLKDFFKKSFFVLLFSLFISCTLIVGPVAGCIMSMAFVLFSAAYGIIQANDKTKNLTNFDGDLFDGFNNRDDKDLRIGYHIQHAIKDILASFMSGILFIRMLVIPGTAPFASWLNNMSLSGENWGIVGAMLTGGASYSVMKVSDQYENRNREIMKKDYVDWVKRD